ncbi:hypothetical protein C2845_PM05G21920 [Panicum miliaceum]|uniref:Aminotransferase class I/classII large domain-containing protein n=1 Tax=Panicum miliaceum TaxID=4540 RepID=A0A3L6SYW2_PANMI|nr:hypothetical protein C2845_PM05G21920 [Panicum miliaceum]
MEGRGPRSAAVLGSGEPTEAAALQARPLPLTAATTLLSALISASGVSGLVDAVGGDVSSRLNLSRASGGHGKPSCLPVSAVATYMSRYLPYELSTGDVVLTAFCNHGIEIMMAVLATPGANVLLPRPGYPLYEARAALSGLKFQHYDLLPENGWEVDIQGVKTLANENTIAMVIINPNNPSGAVYSSPHLAKIAETARELGIMVISDEVYEHFVFGSKPFVPMGVFGEIAPVVTLGGISKRWMVPGWKLCWIAMTDPKGVLRKKKIFESIIVYRGISVDPAAIVQIKLDMSCFCGIDDDIDFCCKLAKEESVVISPGSGLEMKNWLRISMVVDPPLLEDGLERVKSFCLRHVKPIMNQASFS